MSVVESLNESPSDEQLKKYQIYSLIIGLAFYFVMFIVMSLSGNDSSKIVTSEIAFSADYLKDIYWDTADLNLYRIGQILDYGFMVGYGIFIFTTATRLARKFEKNSMMNKIGMWVAVGGLIALFLDVVENIFILLTLQDPFGFPPIYAILESTFSLPKWIIILIALVYALLAVVVNFIKKSRQ